MAGVTQGPARSSGGAGLPKPGGTPIKFKPVVFGNPGAPKQAAPKAPARGPSRPSAPPNPLAPLSPQQIQQQAAKTVNSAYSGAFSNLDNQTQQAQNLYHTQQADDAAFNQWLASNAQAMQAQTDNVNQHLTDILTQMRSAQAAALNPIPAQQAASVASSNPDISQQQLQNAAAHADQPFINAAEAHANTQGIAQAEAGMHGNALMVGSAQVAQGRIEQTRAAQFDTLNKTLNTIASDRAKLTAARTGDINKEIARLQGVEISKAQYLQNQNVLQQQLGIKQQTANAATQNANTNTYNAQIKALADQETARHNAAMEAINKTHYANQNAHDAAVLAETQRHNKAAEGIAQQNANTSAAKAAGAGSGSDIGAAPGIPLPQGVKPGTPAGQAKVRQYITEIANALKYDIQKYHTPGGKVDPNALTLAWHDIQNPTNIASDSYLARLYQKGYPVGLINAAANTLTQYGGPGLTAGDQRWLAAQGLQNLDQYFPIQSQAGRGGVPGFTG